MTLSSLQAQAPRVILSASFTDQSKQTKTSKRFGDPQRERGGGWASWAIHGLFKKLTDCGDAS